MSIVCGWKWVSVSLWDIFFIWRTLQKWIKIFIAFTYIEVEQSVPIDWAELLLVLERILWPYKQFLIVFRSKKYNIPRAQNFPLLKVQCQNNQVFQKCEEYETNDIPKYGKGLKRINITGLIRKIRQIYIFLQLVLFRFFHMPLPQAKMTHAGTILKDNDRYAAR